MKEDAAAKASSRGGGLARLAFWLVTTVVFFTVITQRMMLSNESSALETLTAESNKFLALLHRNHGDTIIKMDISKAPEQTTRSTPPSQSLRSSKPAPLPLPKDTRSFTEKLGDYVDAPPTPATVSRKASTVKAATTTTTKVSTPFASKSRPGMARGSKVRQPNLVEDESPPSQAIRLGKQHPLPKFKLEPVSGVNVRAPPLTASGLAAAAAGLPATTFTSRTTATSTATATLPTAAVIPNPKSKPKPKSKPQPSPLDALPAPPDPSYHPRISPRPGTDISLTNQMTALRCPNQSACIVPELQLEVPLKIYFCRHPARHGVRFYYLMREGLHLHPNVQLLPFENIDSADFVIYLPGSSPWHLTECTNSSLKHKLLVLDEFDGYNLFHPFERIEQVQEVYGKDLMWYFMYFKRSFVARRDGKFLSHPHIHQPDVFPMTYAIADAYISRTFNFKREIDILCTLRGSSKMITRMRVQEWIAEYAKSRNVVNAITEQVNTATRTTLSVGYFQQMYNSKIIVTVNPANWEGDFRLWESMATGALIFVDPIFVPHSYPLLDGVHAIYFSNENKTDLFSKLDYYRQNPEEGRKIAHAGYLHAMKYHRTVNLVDYVLRSAHLKRAKLQGLRGDALPRYRYTAQFLNHQTVKQQQDIKKNDRPGAYHHDHLDHHDHSLVKHHVEHHDVIHSKIGRAFSTLASAFKAATSGKDRVERNPLLGGYPSLVR